MTRSSTGNVGLVSPNPKGQGSKEPPSCVHHWVIEPSNGPISWGVCQICHEGKEFQNSIPGYSEWGDNERSPTNELQEINEDEEPSDNQRDSGDENEDLLSNRDDEWS